MIKRLAAVALAGAVVTAGCGSDTKAESQSSMSSSHHSAKAGGSGASDLRAGLTAQLQEHVYLAGIAVSQGVGEGLDSAQFKAAAGTLDANSKALSDSIGSVYGDAAGKQFLALWRKHIGFFVDYTKGKATKDKAVVAKALKDLDGYRAEFGAFIASANPNLPADAVADELTPHIATLTAAIDSAVAGKADVFDKLRAAADHMPMTAEVLAGGIVKQYPDKFAGDVASGASDLHAGLTAQLQEHVYLAGIAVSQGVGQGLDSAEFKAAAATLDANSKALSDSIGSVYGDAAGKQFLPLWRKHIGFFVDYTEGKATGDKAMAAKALENLDRYRTDFGAFIESANPNLPTEAVAAELKPHVATLAAAIDSAVAGKTDVFDKLRTAADHMPMTAKVLSDGIVKQFPDKF